jgi:DNA gyrase/topoisomerase IV subunit B
LTESTSKHSSLAICGSTLHTSSRKDVCTLCYPRCSSVRYKDKLYFGMTKEEIYKQTGTQKCDVQYIKGWGEVNASEMYIAMTPGHRRLIRLTAPDKKGGNELVELLGKKPAYRKKLLGVE